MTSKSSNESIEEGDTLNLSSDKNANNMNKIDKIMDETTKENDIESGMNRFPIVSEWNAHNKASELEGSEGIDRNASEVNQVIGSPNKINDTFHVDDIILKTAKENNIDIESSGDNKPLLNRNDAKDDLIFSHEIKVDTDSPLTMYGMNANILDEDQNAHLDPFEWKEEIKKLQDENIAHKKFVEDLKEEYNKQKRLNEDLTIKNKEQSMFNEELKIQNRKQAMFNDDLIIANKEQSFAINQIQKQIGNLNILLPLCRNEYKERLNANNQTQNEFLPTTNNYVLNERDRTNDLIESNESKAAKLAIVYDIPSILSFISRFTYALIPFMEKEKIGLFMSCAWGFSVGFEMVAKKMENKANTTYYVFNIISGMIFWITFQLVYALDMHESQTATIYACLFSGVVSILSELSITYQIKYRGLPKTLLISHILSMVTQSISISFLYFDSFPWLNLFRISVLIQSILILIGLPIIRSHKSQTTRMQDVARLIQDNNHLQNQQHYSYDLSPYDNNQNTFISSNINIDPNDDNKIISQILLQHQNQIKSLEQQYKKSSNDKIITLSQITGWNREWTTKAQLSPDAYAMMIVSPWTELCFRHPFDLCGNIRSVVVLPFPTLSWMLGLVVFIIQMTITIYILLDKIDPSKGNTLLNIPIRTNPHVRTFQGLAIIFLFMIQTDMLTTYRDLMFLRYGKPHWIQIMKKIKYAENLHSWIGSIMFPCTLRFLQGGIISISIFIVILQSDDIVNLFTNFAALLIVSAIDDFVFFLAYYGCFGSDLTQKTKDVKDTIIREDDKIIKYLVWLFTMIYVGSMFGVWIAVWKAQTNGFFLYQKYPLCNALEPEFIGDGSCHFQKGVESNTLNCGWEGGDCISFNEHYPDCNVTVPYFIGDGDCILMDNYNTEECGWDGGDCAVFNKRYPGCDVMFESNIRNGECNGGPYNTLECDWDGGDCSEFNTIYPDCEVNDPTLIGNNVCDNNEYNTEACGWDGGDCHHKKYPHCKQIVPSTLGDGKCNNNGNYNTEDCGWDGGDCILFNNYPNCTVDFASAIGNGICDGGDYNTEECGWDGGDCLHEKYPNCKGVDYPHWIGNGSCENYGHYNTEECGYDGGDCVEFNKKYPNCTVDVPLWIGNGVCDGGEYNDINCGFDGGDCAEINSKLHETYPNCFVYFPLVIGNGWCNGGDYNTEECGWDGGDCIELNEKYPNCSVDYRIGDGMCDNFGTHNTEECGWDGGDCL